MPPIKWVMADLPSVIHSVHSRLPVPAWAASARPSTLTLRRAPLLVWSSIFDCSCVSCSLAASAAAYR
jgi:hypothetical protein